MKDIGKSLPPELSGLFEEARRGAPSPSPALQERVLARVEATVAAPPSGSGGGTLAGTVAKGGLALLVALGGGYAAYKAVGTSAPKPVASPIAVAIDATAPEPAQSVVPRSVAQAAPQVRPVPVEEPTPQHMQRARQVERPDPLALEEALLEKARTHVSARPQRALRLLAQHAKQFPQGQLAEERELLRARAHLANGDTASARDIARRFLETHPHSVNRRAMENIWEKH